MKRKICIFKHAMALVLVITMVFGSLPSLGTALCTWEQNSTCFYRGMGASC